MVSAMKRREYETSLLKRDYILGISKGPAYRIGVVVSNPLFSVTQESKLKIWRETQDSWTAEAERPVQP